MTTSTDRAAHLIDHASRAVDRERELTKLPKHILADMHVRNGGQMGHAIYLKWRKEELVKILLEDEGLDPWSA